MLTICRLSASEIDCCKVQRLHAIETCNAGSVLKACSLATKIYEGICSTGKQRASERSELAAAPL